MGRQTKGPAKQFRYTGLDLYHRSNEKTFMRPFPASHGDKTSPTGKSFKVAVSTIAHWDKCGLMDEDISLGITKV